MCLPLFGSRSARVSDWFTEWPADALKGVATAMVTETDLELGDALEGIVEMFRHVSIARELLHVEQGGGCGGRELGLGARIFIVGICLTLLVLIAIGFPLHEEVHFSVIVYAFAFMLPSIYVQIGSSVCGDYWEGVLRIPKEACLGDPHELLGATGVLQTATREETSRNRQESLSPSGFVESWHFSPFLVIATLECSDDLGGSITSEE